MVIWAFEKVWRMNDGPSILKQLFIVTPLTLVMPTKETFQKRITRDESEQ